MCAGMLSRAGRMAGNLPQGCQCSFSPPGRRSGTVRRTPLVFGRDGDDYIVVASFNGAPKDPDWFVNLAADPEVVVQVGPEVMPGAARVAGPAERERLWARMTAISPGYEDAAAKAGRQIPVVVISTQ